MSKKYEDLSIIEQVPEYHMLSPTTKMFIEAITDPSLDAQERVMDVVNQFWVLTATWGLDLWERLLDIETDLSLSLEARRSAIVAKMRGSGTCNAEMVSNVAEAITGYEAVVVEHPEDYTFSLIFVGDKPGFINVDRQSIIDAVELIKPAHLQFIIEGITWKDLHAVQYTWQMMHAEQLTWFDLHTKVMVQQKGTV